MSFHDRVERYAKQRVALRYTLSGRGWHDAVAALDFAEAHHTGTRKDGRTPEAAHQVAIALFVLTLPAHLHPQETVCAALLHDVREDYDVSDAEIRERFGALVADAVDAMTKEFEGIRRPDADVFAAIAADPVASLVKPADRINNQDSMVGVFSVEKMAAYAQETEALFFPMMKAARRTFHAQELSYENMKLVLESQVRFIDALTGRR